MTKMNNYLEERKRIIKLVNLVNKSLNEFSGNSNMFQQQIEKIFSGNIRSMNHLLSQQLWILNGNTTTN